MGGFQGMKGSRGPRPSRLMTQRQRELIEELDLGYTTPALDAMTRDEASKIIDEELQNRAEQREEAEMDNLTSWDRPPRE